MIHLEDLCIDRDGRSVLRGLQARIPRTGLTALIGPNGAGKSTLLHAMAGLLPPAQGRVMVGDTDIAAARPQHRAHLVALLTQSPMIVPRLTVSDLVGFGRWPHHRGRPGPHDRDLVQAALTEFDLQELAGRSIDSLSGGQRQRTYVAMAYAQATPWMLLDEPLSALDPRYARDIMDRLWSLSRPGPDARGVVIVLHDLGMAARYADWVLSLRDGLLVSSGPRAEVMTSRDLSDLFDTSLAVEECRGHPVVVAV